MEKIPSPDEYNEDFLERDMKEWAEQVVALRTEERKKRNQKPTEFDTEYERRLKSISGLRLFCSISE